MVKVNFDQILSDDKRGKLSLSKLVNKPIKDVVGFIGGTFHDFTVFTVIDIIFEDGSDIDLDGEDDHAFIYGDKKGFPTLETKVLEDLFEQNPDK